MVEDLSTNEDFLREQYQTPQDFRVDLVAGAGTAISNLNGLSGPNVTFGGGTSGFSFSVASPNITLSSPLTTKGDLLVRNATQGVRLAVGVDAAFLVADSAQATGIKWLAGQTGWAAATGTASRATFATYAGQTISNPPTQAEVQNIDDHVKILSQRMKAIEDDLLTLKIFKP